MVSPRRAVPGRRLQSRATSGALTVIMAAGGDTPDPDNDGGAAMNVYGITNCDTVKEARAWLAERGVSHRFVDFKKAPPTRDQLQAWCDAAGWQTLLNRRGTTWKKLEPEAQARVVDAKSAIAVMVANPTAIRRPVVESDQGILVGFDPGAWDHAFPG
jgi:arsenate reductase